MTPSTDVPKCAMAYFLRLSLLTSLLGLLGLLAVSPVSGAVRITEFMADNANGITDENFDHEDWIELFNDGTNAVPLDGWALTDSAANLTKWRFPATNIGPGKFIVVFASSKDRRTPGAPLHTNFKLGADGEYLALVQPDGTTIATEFAPLFPIQARDRSYGFASETRVAALSKGAPVRWRVWTTQKDFNNQSPGWNSNLNYSLTSWNNSTSGLGWDDEINQVNLTPYFGSNGTSPRSLMYSNNTALFTRFTFPLTNVASASSLRLRMRYNDGFKAWLNGIPVATSSAPAGVSWTNLATAARDESLNAAWAVFNLPVTSAMNGTNLLAIQSLRLLSTNESLLLLPELDLSYPATATAPAYLFTPTPGTTNSSATTDVGPAIALLSQAARPVGGAGSPALTVTALVTRALAPITNVTLYYRVMFSNETAVPMTPATGGVCTATIPTTGLTAGRMLRWRIEARDSSNNVGTGPLFLDANDDDRYYGTVALNPAETNSRLPVLNWFVNNYPAAATEGGTRCSLFYLDRFYDNVITTLHGQSTRDFPKKSHDFDFNGNNRFKWRAGEEESKDVHLLSNWADKSKVRNTLAYEMFARTGLPTHWAFPVRVQTNGGFHAILDLVEDGDDRYLERVGLDPEGALYKVYQSTELPAGATWICEKKSRHYDNDTDLTNFCQRISTLNPMAARQSYVYDNVDLATTINYLAAMVLANSDDQGHKNFYLYRDSNGTRQWSTLPWDVDLTFGRKWTFSDLYFNDTIYTNTPIPSGDVNDFTSIIYGNAELNAMFLRRLRTLMDEVLQPDSAPPALKTNENRIAELMDVMDPTNIVSSDADLDFTKWGWWTNSTQQFSAQADQEIRPQAQRIRDIFLPGRRSYLNSLSPTSSGAPIPLAQPTNVNIVIEAIDYNPASGNQAHEYIELRNPNAFAVDFSGWKLQGAIDYKFPPGTVIPAGAATNGNIGKLFVACDPYAFRQRLTAPTSNQNCLVSGPYQGQLSARGETLTLHDRSGWLVSSNTYAGNPSPAQQFLRVTEIMYSPAPAPALTNNAQALEYVELRNISTNVSLNLNGVRFAGGITFSFTGSAVTNLLPGQRVVVVRSQPMFAARYGGGPLVAGVFAGSLDSNGEQLRLEDAVGEKILEFSYNNSWYPITDGLGFSLVIVDDTAPWFTWADKASWRPSGELHGSPGSDSAPTPSPPTVVINEVLAHTDLPLVDSIELFNPGTNTASVGGWFVTDDFFTPKKYRIPTGTTLAPGAFLVLSADTSFGIGATPFLLSEYGESVALFATDSQTNLTGAYQLQNFGASPNGVSLGRHIDSQGGDHFVLQKTNSLGAANGLPRVGPVVISEIMYHPPDLPGLVDNDLDEYLELQNIAPTNVALFCTDTNVPGYAPAAATNTWRLRNAVDFDFPTNLTLAAGGRLLIVGFNPQTNLAQLTAFRAHNNVPTNVLVLGPWSGKLDNSAETIELKQPGVPDPTNGTFLVPYIQLEEITYRDVLPWQSGADGLGNSLQRQTNSAFGDDPINWSASAKSAGRANVANLLPEISFGAPANLSRWNVLQGIPITINATDADGNVTNLALHANGNLIAQLNTPPWQYVWTNAALGTNTLMAIATDDSGGMSASMQLSLVVTSLPPSITLTFPTNQAILPANSNLLLTVTVSDPDSPVASVDYFDNGNLLASVATPPFSLSWTFLTPGPHAVAVIARDAGSALSQPSVAQVFAQASASESTQGIASNAVWRYFEGGTNPGVGWNQLIFNDTSWNFGAAELGYGDSAEGRPENTVIGYGPDPDNKYPACYFRHTFTLPPAAAPSSAVLNLMRDDGAIVYLNGIEIYRTGMDTGTPTHVTYATNSASGADEYLFYSANFDSALLTAGTNLLAVEVHQVDAASTDLSFAATLTYNTDLYGPAIITQPQSQTRTNGQSVTFTVQSLGSPALKYFWQQNGTTFSSTASNSITLSNLGLANAGEYTVLVSNSVGTALSSPAQLTIVSVIGPIAYAQAITNAEDLSLPITLSVGGNIGPVTNYVVVTNPVHGTLTGTAPHLTYNPSANYFGPDNFAFRVHDGSLTSAVAVVSLTLTNVNDAPVAYAQSLTNAEDAALAITLIGADVDGPATNYIVVTNPVNGIVSGTAPNLTYTPATNYFGPDSLVFQVYDGSLNSDVTTVSLTLTNVNDAPVANPDQIVRYETQGTTTLGAVLLTNDTDVDGDLLSMTEVSNATPLGATLQFTNGVVSYQPPPGDANVGSLEYIIIDSQGGSATGLVSVAVAPDPPGTDELNITASPGPSIHLTLTGQPDFIYTFQFTDALQPFGWQNWLVTNASAGGEVTVTDETAAGPTNRFYRTIRGIAP